MPLRRREMVILVLLSSTSNFRSLLVMFVICNLQAGTDKVIGLVCYSQKLVKNLRLVINVGLSLQIIVGGLMLYSLKFKHDYYYFCLDSAIYMFHYL